MVYGASPSFNELSINDATIFRHKNHRKQKKSYISCNIVIIGHLPFLAFIQEGLLNFA